MRASATTLAAETTGAERSALLDVLRQARLTGQHLEIGTAAGGTLKELMAIYPEAKRPPFVVVDPLVYFPDQRRAVERNLLLPGIDPATVDFRVSKSWPALQRALAANERFSFIFIDAVHDANHVMQDLAWARMLEVGGLVALHDHNPCFPGVIWAVRYLLKKQPNYAKVADAETLVVLKKTAPSAFPEVSGTDRILPATADVRIRWRRSISKRFGTNAL
jgi:predicted O-methyltransferase YrrM